MATNLTLIFVAETRSVVAVATRTALSGQFETYSGLSDAEKKPIHAKELEALVGNTLPIANNLRPTDPQVDISIPRSELDAVLSASDANLMLAPLTYSVNAQGEFDGVTGTISAVALQTGRTAVKVSVSPAVTGTAKVWMRIQPANSSHLPQTVTGQLSSAIDSGNSVTIPITVLPSGDFVVLAMAEKYPPKFAVL